MSRVDGEFFGNGRANNGLGYAFVLVRFTIAFGVSTGGRPGFRRGERPFVGMTSSAMVTPSPLATRARVERRKSKAPQRPHRDPLFSRERSISLEIARIRAA